jgi:acetate---CoA ligase (ADP-forming)
LNSFLQSLQQNPVDVIGDAAADRYENAISAVMKDDGVDACLVILTPQSMTEVLGTAEAIVKICRSSHKPVVCCFMGIFDVSVGVRYLQQHSIPCFKFPENAARSLGALHNYSKWLNRQHLSQFELKHDKDTAEAIIKSYLEQGRQVIGELDGYKILNAYGFRTMPTELATSAVEATKIADKFGYPVVLKIYSQQILHKSDANGVLVDLKTPEEVENGFKTVVENARLYDENAVIEGVLVQKLASKGEEVILGSNRYPVFGPLLMFGIGGIFVEVL